jgi:hypothetical protein
MRHRTLALLLALLALPLNATKPCPPSPCLSYPGGRFDYDKCQNASDWVALGRIKNLVHHPAGYPLLKDFATFTFVVDRWLRGGDRKIREIPFTVGWCKNTQEMTGDYGYFTFWGKNQPKVANAEWEYVYFERADIPF